MTAARTNAGVPALAIKYEATQDNVSGEPWPPDGGGYWAIVGRIRVHALTVWRHIGITNTGSSK
jgi:hypothetical protein